MSGVIPSHDVVVVREGDAEILASGPVTGLLYADSSATGGALSSQRIVLRHGAAGATPHHHTGSSELFYVVSGAAEMLTGERVVTVAEGDLAVVPPGTVHAFAAAPASDADLLIILAPGVERFEYFRQLQRIAARRPRWRASSRRRISTTTTSTTARSGSRRSRLVSDRIGAGDDGGAACYSARSPRLGEVPPAARYDDLGHGQPWPPTSLRHRP
jgi:mannose-6-phosphate isomerase-like protein (cupin superfamily)